MNRLEAYLMHLSTIVLVVTGVAYAWMRYMMQPVDPFSVVNHPWEPHMLSAHILVAPLLLLAFGLIIHGHILFKIASGAKTARRSGWVLMPTFGLMVISGYLLQVITSDLRKSIVVIHLITGLIWAIFYSAHQIASFAQRRVRSNEKVRTRFPVQVVLIAVLLALPGESGTTESSFERQVHVMGTTLRVFSLEENEQKALRDTEALIRVIEQADDQLSTWKKESELSLFNNVPSGVPIVVTPTLFTVLKRIQGWNILTNGAFDPAIGHLLDAWGVHRTFRIPSDAELSNALASSGFRHLKMNERDLWILKERNVRIDPGGFGKGEALDRALALAVELKMAPVMLDFGGQIAVHETPQAGWSAFLARPDDRSALEQQKLFIRTGSLSTSGFSERSGKVGGRTIHHILNPVTGNPVAAFGSVTVWHEKALAADILSTALCVMGAEKGYRWAVQHRIAAAFILDDRILKTPEFLRQFPRQVAVKE